VSTSSVSSLLLLLFIVGIVFANALTGSFHYDDFHSLFLNPHVRYWANIPAFFSDPSLFSADADKAMYRPLLLTSYALNYAWGQYETTSYHVVNLAIHMGCIVLVWALARRFNCGSEGALLAAALFALHPLATEPVNYISSRSESLAALFMLAALYFYRGNSSAWERGLSWSCCIAGMLVKSIAVTLPAILLLYDLLWSKERVQWKRHIPYWVCTGGYLTIIVSNRFLSSSLAKAPRSLGDQFLTQGKALVYYVQLVIMPTHLNVEHQFFVSESLWGVTSLLSVLFLASVAVVVVRCRQSPWLFWVGWIIVSLLPTLVVPLNVLVNEHRLYMPLAALALAAGRAWQQGGGGGANRVVYVLLVACALLTYERNKVWSDELSLWQDAVHKSPEMSRPQVYLGNALRENSDYPGAKRAYEKAIELDAEHRSARTNLANIYFETAQRDSARAGEYLQRAEQQYLQVLGLDPTYSEALNNLGSLYLMRGELARAEQVLVRLVEEDPNFSDAYYNWGQVKALQGYFSAAAEIFERGLVLKDDGETWYELGNARARLNQLPEAILAYRRAIQQSAYDPHALYNLAEVLLVAGEKQLRGGRGEQAAQMWHEAEGLLQRIIAQNPSHERAVLRLRQLRERQK
jgi:tetratricopeptide (TPR) repeat protein